MGLDMYLEKRKYIGGNYQHRKVSGVVKIQIGEETFEVSPTNISDITMHVGYWRKANQIHNWFVTNVQDGVDECQKTYVPFEKLEELRDLCLEVLETKDATLLPPSSGFFFGGTDVDEYYFNDLEETVEMLRYIDKDDGFDYYYQSSW